MPDVRFKYVGGGTWSVTQEGKRLATVQFGLGSPLSRDDQREIVSMVAERVTRSLDPRAEVIGASA